MKKFMVRAMFALLLAAYVLSHFFAKAHASSLGIGTGEAVVPSTGLFAGWMLWINTQQQAFYRALTGALKAMRDDGGQAWLMVGLSFAYGVFHAAGPGHGKAVISSYMLANEVALRRGVMLSFVSAFLQGLVAVLLMATVYLALRGTALKMADATWYLEVASFAMITAFGAWLVWQKAWPRLRSVLGAAPAHSLSAANVGGLAFETPAAHDMFDGHDHSQCNHVQLRGAGRSQGHAAGGFAVCENCGHSHLPDPALISGDRFSWKTAWSAVLAVGLRPCSGALIVLTFAFLNGLWLAGIVSVAAMALGTAITVSALATLAVTAKNVAVRLAGDGRAGNRVHAAIEIGGALLVLLLGLTLLMASLSA